MTSLLFKRDLARCYSTGYKKQAVYHSLDVLRMSKLPGDIEQYGWYGDRKCVLFVIENSRSSYNSYMSLNHWTNRMLVGAAERNRIDVIHWLFELGADSWDFVLWGASCGGHMDLVRYAIQQGADELEEGFIDACIHGHLEIAKYLYEQSKLELSDLILAKKCVEKYNHRHMTEYLNMLYEATIGRQTVVI